MSKIIRLTTSSFGAENIPYIREADIVIDRDGKVIKDRTGLAGRRATDQEMNDAEVIEHD